MIVGRSLVGKLAASPRCPARASMRILVSRVPALPSARGGLRPDKTLRFWRPCGHLCGHGPSGQEGRGVKPLKTLVGAAGLEPATPCLEVPVSAPTALILLRVF